jgi:methionyl-tRNA formyltransferase
VSPRLGVVFAGTPEFAVPPLEAIAASTHRLLAVYTQPDRRAGRGLRLEPSPVKRAALERELPVEQPATLKDGEAAARLAAYAPDVMVVVAYGLLLPQAVLDVPRLGCLNIHASLLPRWRGAAPIQRAILAGDAVTGITIMRMEAGLDTGPMLCCEAVPIGEHDTGATLHERLAAVGARLVVAALDDLAAGRARLTEQDAAAATYARKLDKAEALIDWRLPAGEIERRVRAFNPWPVAETRLGGVQLRIWRARVASAPPGPAPGTVIATGEDGIVVMTGSDALVIERLQRAGKRPVSAAEFLRAEALDGVRLGAEPAAGA